MPLNLLAVQHSLNYLLASDDSSTNKFKKEQRDFLKDMLTEIIVTNQGIQERLRNKLTDPSLTATDKVNQYMQNVKDACEFCIERTEKIKQAFDKFSDKRFLERNFGANKLFLDNFEAVIAESKDILQKIISAEEKQSEKPNDLSQSDVNRVIDKSVEWLGLNALPYWICDISGGYFFPMKQACDPLTGKASKRAGIDFLTKKRKVIWGEENGKCDGYVKQGRDQIERTGCPDYAPVMTEHTQWHFETQGGWNKEYLHAVKNMISWTVLATTPNDTKKFIDRAMERMRSDQVYKIGYLLDGPHSTRVRIIPTTNIIEFYEPNYGTFFFYSKEDFANFFSLLISLDKLGGTNNKHFFCYSIGKNKVPEKIPVPRTPQKELTPSTKDAIFMSYIDAKNRLNKENGPIIRDILMTLVSSAKERSTLEKIKLDLESSPNLDTNLQKLLPLVQKKLDSLGKLPSSNRVTKFFSSVHEFFSGPTRKLIPITEPETKKAVFFSDSDQTITIENFKPDAVNLFDALKQQLENYLVNLDQTSKVYPQLKLLENDIAKGRDYLEQTNNLEVIKALLVNLSMDLENINDENDVASLWSTDPKEIKENTRNVVKQMQAAIENFQQKYSRLTPSFSSKVAGLTAEERLEADKKALETILQDYQKDNDRFINKMYTVFNKPNPLILKANEELKALLQSQSSPEEFENAVHKINQTLAHCSNASFSKKLSGFFQDHLGYKQYSRSQPGIYLSEPLPTPPSQRQSDFRPPGLL